MFNRQLLERVLNPEKKLAKIALDSASDPDMDGDFDDAQGGITAASIVQQWAETDDLDPGETLADRLFQLILGSVDEDIDGELSDAEQEEFDDLCDYTGQYLARLNVPNEDISALLNDWDDNAAERVVDQVLKNMPDGDDALDDINGFVFDTSEALDSAAMSKRGGGIYKKVRVIRQGVLKEARVRIGGSVKVSPKVKAHLAKVRGKSKSAAALRKWKRSMGLRRKSGLKNISRK